LPWGKFRRSDAQVDGADAPTIADGAGRCPLPNATDYCNALPALPNAPVIDGVVECDLRLKTLPASAYRASRGPLPAGFTASYAAAWRPDGLYVFVRVLGATNDPPLPAEDAWCGDDVEIFVDHDGVFDAPPAYDGRGTNQFIVSAPLAGQSRSTRGVVFNLSSVQGPWRASQWTFVRAHDGYDFEAFVTGVDVNLVAPWTLAAGGRVGFDLAVTLGTGTTSDAGLCHHLLGQMVLRRATDPLPMCDGHPSCDVRAFCLPTLLR
jgi:hypothetical protein